LGEVLARIRPELDEEGREIRLLATFRLRNSKPFSVRRSRAPTHALPTLAAMAISALLDSAPSREVSSD
jgi:hypothetical protein